ncbi:MAG: HDIG domain-containing protein [candidate division Zixibacteria bacterium]|nr:HDIG domain-containing protein [candidate division Zixibacteria bacterium]
MNRNEAWALLTEYTKNPALVKHMVAVEAAMRAYARKFGEDEDTWGTIGLLHDFDYERYPTREEHPFKGAEVLRGLGVDENWIRTILSHADYSGVRRETRRDKALFAVDELCGFLTACALVRPDKKIATVEVASVRKKLKQKSFAAQVSREDITNGAADLGVDLDTHIAFVRDAMATVADQLGL